MTRVDQFVHTFRARDAVSDEARLFRDRLRERGFASAIYAAAVEPAVAHEVSVYERRGPIVADAVLYHYATVAGMGQRLAAWRGRKALLYHGVTPPELLRPYQPGLAALLDEGRAALRRLAPRFPIRLADSRFGADELRALTGRGADVLPFCLDDRRFAARHALAGRQPTAGVRWITVGRIAPNKGLIALVAAFAAYRERDPASTLVLVGTYEATDPYYWAVRAAIDAGGLYGHVRLTGSVDDAELQRLYGESDVYVCLSEHEGFCVPLVEAMRFDVPIVACARAAIPETLGGAGILIPDSDPGTVAAAVSSLGDGRRAAVLAAQRARRTAFDSDRAIGAFDRMIDALLAA